MSTCVSVGADDYVNVAFLVAVAVACMNVHMHSCGWMEAFEAWARTAALSARVLRVATCTMKPLRGCCSPVNMHACARAHSMQQLRATRQHEERKDFTFQPTTRVKAKPGTSRAAPSSAAMSQPIHDRLYHSRCARFTLALLCRTL